MPRLKPPPAKPEDNLPIEDNTLPTENIEIALDDDPVDLAAAPVPAAAVTPAETEDNPLQKQIDAQRRAEDLQRQNSELLRRDREREEQLVQERGRGDEAEYNAVLTAIAAEQAQADKAEADYAGYSSIGDWGNAARAQRALASASARLDRLEDNKAGFDTRREASKTAPPERRPPAQSAEPLDFEQKLDAWNAPEIARTWLRKHPELVNDAGMTTKLASAHNYIISNRGVAAFSQAYFDAIDTEFGFKAAPAAEPTQPQRRSMPVSAPVSREVPSTSGQRQSSSRITLTPEEVRIARSSFSAPDMSNADKEKLYAQNKQKLQRMRANGEYRQTTEQTG